MYDQAMENLLKTGKNLILDQFEDVQRIFQGGYNGSDADDTLIRGVFGYCYLDALKAKIEGREIDELFGEDG